NAVDTDEIVVAPGTYFETIDFLGKTITLRSSDGPDVTIIDAQQTGTVVTCESGEGSNTRLEGFTITGGTGTWSWPLYVGGGMLNIDSSPTVVSCTFSENTAFGVIEGSGGGICNIDSSPMISGCTITGNAVYAEGGGMASFGVSSPTVTDCSFTNNTAFQAGEPSGIGSGGGLADGYGANTTVTNCTFIGNTAEEGGGLTGAGTVVNCRFEGNSATSDTIEGGLAGAILTWGDSIVMNCEFVGNTAGGYGGGMYITVDSPSGGPTVTNCTFEGNHADEGGGMYNENSSPTVTNCTFEGNEADHGGGMFTIRTHDYFSNNPTVTACTFDGNIADSGGGMYNWESNSTVIGCTFTGNVAEQATQYGGNGAGMCNAGAYDDHSSPTLINCVFSNNDARYGGGVCNFASDPTVTNCVFTGNSASAGGLFTQGAGAAMHNDTSSPVISNCTFRGNVNTHPIGDGGGMSNVDSSYPTVTNSVLWESSPVEILDSIDSFCTVRHSDVQGGWPGIGNIDTDPMCVDPVNGDFRLSPGSPCIDAGHNWAIAGLTDVDLDGNPRCVHAPIDPHTGCGIPAIVDMGAYESQDGTAFDIRFGDIDGDGCVDLVEVMSVLADWGACPVDCCLSDLDMDGFVGITDFLLVLRLWG
ncbi:MAG: right-handed parallel beta-helix repeat-containing protein, partial [Planctomycetota bacterium]